VHGVAQCKVYGSSVAWLGLARSRILALAWLRLYGGLPGLTAWLNAIS
jgi:hypothetical protein